MNRNLLIVCSGMMVLVAAAETWVLHEGREAKRWATFSCASSISQTLSLYDVNHPSSATDATSAWRTLADSESRSVLNPISEYCDCSGGRWWKSRPGADAWGRPFHIAVRLGPNQRVEYVVSSGGPDGVFDTADDIKSPVP
jgi:hypothetical protein